MVKKLCILIILSFLLLCCIGYEFYKIEHTIIDAETNTKIAYTKKSDIENLLNDNYDFFNDLVNELNNFNNIENCSRISLPFGNESKYAEFYGCVEQYDLENGEKLSKDLIFLSRELNIHEIVLDKTTDDNRTTINYLFLQSSDYSNTYIGLYFSEDSSLYTYNYSSHYKYIFTVKKYASFSFVEPITKKNNWYYYCSRDFDKKYYNIAYRLYDIINKNL